MTSPAGLPPWTRTSSAATYGGHANKRDYGGIGEVNPETDVSAAQFVRLCTDVAAIARMAPVFRMIVRCQDTGTVGATVLDCVSMVGRAGPYSGSSPPAGFPSVARTGKAQIEITFPSTLTDEFGVSGACLIEFVHTGIVYSAQSGVAQWAFLGNNVVRVSGLDSSGAAGEDMDFAIEAS